MSNILIRFLKLSVSDQFVLTYELTVAALNTGDVNGVPGKLSFLHPVHAFYKGDITISLSKCEPILILDALLFLQTYLLKPNL